MILIGMCAYSQADTNVINADTLQGMALEKIGQALQIFWGYLNWVFIVAFIVFSGIFNMYVNAENKAASMNFFRKLPMAVWVFIFGILLALLFIYAFDIKTKQEITGLIFSILFSMGIYKIGIDKIFKWVAEKLGLQLKK